MRRDRDAAHRARPRRSARLGCGGGERRSAWRAGPPRGDDDRQATITTPTTIAVSARTGTGRAGRADRFAGRSCTSRRRRRPRGRSRTRRRTRRTRSRRRPRRRSRGRRAPFRTAATRPGWPIRRARTKRRDEADGREHRERRQNPTKTPRTSRMCARSRSLEDGRAADLDVEVRRADDEVGEDRVGRGRAARRSVKPVSAAPARGPARTRPRPASGTGRSRSP